MLVPNPQQRVRAAPQAVRYAFRFGNAYGVPFLQTQELKRRHGML